MAAGYSQQVLPTAYSSQIIPLRSLGCAARKRAASLGMTIKAASAIRDLNSRLYALKLYCINNKDKSIQNGFFSAINASFFSLRHFFSYFSLANALSISDVSS